MAFKLKFRTLFPALVTAASPLILTKTGATYAFTFDLNALLSNISSYFAPVQTQQIKTTAGDVTVANSDGAIIVNKTVGGATNVNFPISAGMYGDCLVADFKGDAGTNNITITPTAPETIMGQSSYVISSNSASLRLKPVPGVGYAL